MTDTTEWARSRLERTRDLPNGRLIAEAGYVLAGFGITRDSDPLAESNYSVAMRALCAVAGMDPLRVADLGRVWMWDEDADRPPVAVAHFKHWACGWVDELMIRADASAVLAEADRLLDRLEDYPALDEEDYSEREWEAYHPDDERCYSHDPDCGCGLEKA